MQFYPSIWQTIPLPPPLKTSLFMWGPGLAALIIWRLTKTKNAKSFSKRYQLFRGGKPLNILVYVLPSLLFVGMFSPLLTTQQILFFLVIFNAVAFFNSLGEELGWRGYLQPNLDCLPPFGQFVLIGLMWELWHLPMRIGAIKYGAPIENMLLLSFGTIVLSFIIGFAVKHTRSVTIAVCLHAYMNSIMSLSEVSNISQQALIPYFVIVALFFIVVISLWNNPKLKFLTSRKRQKAA